MYKKKDKYSSYSFILKACEKERKKERERETKRVRKREKQSVLAHEKNKRSFSNPDEWVVCSAAFKDNSDEM